MSTPLTFIDPLQLARLTDLHLLARTVVEGFMVGIHQSPYTGSSIEFAQYRPYVQGDDPRFVDWSLYARTDRLHTKQFHKETNVCGTILLDASASMGYASTPLSKFVYARMLAACLAMLLFRQGDEVGLTAFHDQMEIYIPPRNHPRHLQRILVDLQNANCQGTTQFVHVLDHASETMPRKGLILLLTDLLCPLESLLPPLRRLRAHRHEVLLFCLSDPAEQDFPFDRSATFLDMETQGERFLVPAAVREAYLQNRAAHFAAIRAECLAHEIEFCEITTTQALDRALHEFIHFRNQQRKTTRSRPQGWMRRA